MFHLFARLILDNVGGRLVLPDNCLLPERCAVCNKPTDGPARRLRLRCTAVGSDRARYTIHLHLCGRHAARRKLLLLITGMVAAACLLIVSSLRDGHKPSNIEFAAFCGLIISGLIFINLILNDPFFRGLHLQPGGMAIKGFGKSFRESLKPEEVIVLNPGEDPVAARLPD